MPELKLVKSVSSESYEKAVRRRKRIKALRAGIAAVIVAILGFAFFLYYQGLGYTGYTIISKSARVDADTAKYIGFNGHVLKYSNDGAEAFDGTNRKLWNVTYEMQNPKVETCGDMTAIGDASGTRIYVMDMEGTQTSIDTKLPTVNFCVAEQGVVAAVLDDGDAMRIKLYDRNGTELAGMKCTMSQSGYPIDVSLSPNGTLLGVSYVRVAKGALCSTIAFYNFGDVGQNEIDNYASGYDYNGYLFPQIQFVSDSSCVAVGDHKVTVYHGDQKPEETDEFDVEDEIQSVYYGKNQVGLVLRNGAGNDSYLLKIFDTKNKKETVSVSQNFSLAYTDVALANGLAVIYNDTDCQIYNMNGIQKFNGEFEDSVLLLVPTSSQAKYILVNRNTTQMIRLNKGKHSPVVRTGS